MDMNAPEQPRNSPTSTVILAADKPTGEQPMELFIVDEHTENYLSLQAGGESNRGSLSGLAGWVFIGGLGVGVYSLLQTAEPTGLYIMLGICLPMFLAPFLWETLRPLPLPILFNRRTREVYFDHDGELFHTPWDSITAVANEFQLIGPQIGSIRNASLEIRVSKFEEPETALMISLGAPFGKSLALQKGFWEYLRSYMNNGPYFDEHGNHSESDVFIKSQLAVRFKMSDSFKNTLAQIKQAKKEAGGRNYLSGSDVAMLILEPMFYPWARIQDLTYNIAKRRSRNLWPSVVTERLKSNGPTTRLVDIE
ncbi:hypothetical protein K3F43_12995 [Pseudomonas tussilaginis]|uniref:hypothetical protein n=1 Tax=unclassified Pseudomonas TaxID=196821 RepID=UPI000C6CED0C|nr:MULTISPECIES: hypothetical protein [unclassified Pseudomonas]QYX45628.1 hypothetical protein K3F43_12995 [Pseudomonas sp. S11A 273]